MARSLLFVVFVSVCLALVLAQYNSTVTIPNVGTLQGIEGVSVNSFVGIPYAQPPVGDLRFTYPQAAAAFSGVFNATSYGNICPQLLNGLFAFPNQNLSEDCLTLNIYAPSSAGLKPVLFYVHAGAFIQGSGSEYRYHGQNLAAQENIVIVTINYRLGALGSLAHPSLDATEGNSGTYTLADQALAFTWVRNNIQYFGGDNTQITFGGISAGGASTIYALANPNLNQYIHQAIIQSADPIAQAQSKDSALNLGVEVASLLYCNGTNAQILSCLRAATYNQYITLAPYSTASRVAVDGRYLMDAPYNLITQSKVKEVPSYIGNSLDEVSLFVYTGQTAPLSVPAYRPFLATQIHGYLPGVNTYSVYETYPCASYTSSDCRAAATVAISDAVIFCQTALYADPSGDYGYVFSYHPSYVPPEQGAPHLSDIPFHFNSLNLSTFAFNANDQQVANVVSSYFGAFIRSGNPNYVNAPANVPNFQTAGYPRIDFDSATPSQINDFKTLNESPACQYWSTVYKQLAQSDLIMEENNSSAVAEPCPVATPCPSVVAATPCPSCPVRYSPCPSCPSCPSCPQNNGNNGGSGVDINFYFANMLNGAATPSASSSGSR